MDKQVLDFLCKMKASRPMTGFTFVVDSVGAPAQPSVVTVTICGTAGDRSSCKVQFIMHDADEDDLPYPQYHLKHFDLSVCQVAITDYTEGTPTFGFADNEVEADIKSGVARCFGDLSLVDRHAKYTKRGFDIKQGALEDHFGKRFVGYGRRTHRLPPAPSPAVVTPKPAPVRTSKRTLTIHMRDAVTSAVPDEQTKADNNLAGPKLGPFAPYWNLSTEALFKAVGQIATFDEYNTTCGSKESLVVYRQRQTFTPPSSQTVERRIGLRFDGPVIAFRVLVDAEVVPSSKGFRFVFPGNLGEVSTFHNFWFGGNERACDFMGESVHEIVARLDAGGVSTPLSINFPIPGWPEWPILLEYPDQYKRSIIVVEALSLNVLDHATNKLALPFTPLKL